MMYEEVVGEEVKVHALVGEKTYTYSGKVLDVDDNVLVVSERGETHYIGVKTIVHLVVKK